MKDNDFMDLLKGVKQMRDIKARKIKAGRVFRKVVKKRFSGTLSKREINNIRKHEDF